MACNIISFTSHIKKNIYSLLLSVEINKCNRTNEKNENKDLIAHCKSLHWKKQINRTIKPYRNFIHTPKKEIFLFQFISYLVPFGFDKAYMVLILLLPNDIEKYLKCESFCQQASKSPLQTSLSTIGGDIACQITSRLQPERVKNRGHFRKLMPLSQKLNAKSRIF